MKVPIITLDTPNANHRIYPKDVVEKVLEKYRKEFVTERRALVVNKQPESGTINLKDVIGVVKEITIEEGKVVVDVEFFSDFYKQILESGKFHLRTSGLGTLKEDQNGNEVIQEDYELITFFITDDPA